MKPRNTGFFGRYRSLRMTVVFHQKRGANMKKQGKGIVFILIAGLFWGTMGLFVRGLNGVGLDAMQIVFIRVAIAAVIILLGVLIKDRGLLKIRLRDLWCFAANAILSILIFYYCYFATIETSSLAVAAVLLYTAPVFVMIFSLVLFKERLTMQKIIACIMAVAGCALVAGIFDGGSGHISKMSLLTGLISGISYALYSIFSRCAINRGYSSATITVYTFIIAAVVMLPFADYAAIGAAFGVNFIKTALLSLGLAVFVTVIPYLLYTKGLESVASSRASIMASIEPVTACVLGVSVFDEKLSIFAIIGIALVIGAIAVLNLKMKTGESKNSHLRH